MIRTVLISAALAMTWACVAPQKPAPPPAQASACHLEQLSHLIGQPESAIPMDQLPPRHRVICFGCMATMDFFPDRLTIQMGPGHTIASMRCG